MPRLLKPSEMAELLGMSSSQLRKSKEAAQILRLFGARGSKWRQRRYVDSKALRLWAKHRREVKLASMSQTAVRRGDACSLSWSSQRKRNHIQEHEPLLNQDDGGLLKWAFGDLSDVADVTPLGIEWQREPTDHEFDMVDTRLELLCNGFHPHMKMNLLALAKKHKWTGSDIRKLLRLNPWVTTWKGVYPITFQLPTQLPS